MTTSTPDRATRIEERICELAEGTLEDLREEQLERFEIAGLFREALALVRIGFIRNSGLSADALKRLKAVEDEACAIYRERTREKERVVIDLRQNPSHDEETRRA